MIQGKDFQKIFRGTMDETAGAVKEGDRMWHKDDAGMDMRRHWNKAVLD